MYLREVEIFGFKSFARATRIRFAPGISALVGPNGGGKSNVLDAIRFALGEQRPRELRLERWEDLLFAGTAEVPGARLAEVTLRFDNRDRQVDHWPETLEVTRRYFRQGLFEYAINGRPARLKEVHDLFWNSGIGRNAYALITQGRVEQALFMRPKEREEQLEEAAQVSRYKVRRSETVAHLQEAVAHLARVEDQLAEVEREQAAVADAARREERYLALRDEAARLSQRIEATRFARDQGEMAALRAELAQIQQEQSRLEEMAHQAEQTAAHLDQGLQRRQGELERWRAAVEHWEAQIAEARQQAAQHEAWLDAGRREYANLAERLQALSQEIERHAPGASDPLENLGAGADALGERVETMAAAVRTAREQLERIREEARRAEQHLGEVQTRLVAVEQLLSQWQAQLQWAHREQGGSLADQWQAFQAAVEAEGQKVREWTAELDQLTQSRMKLQSFVRDLEGRVETVRQQLAQRQARLRALRQLEAEGVGLAPGVRAVLAAHREGRFPGLLGTLGSLLETEPHWRLALTVALGPAHQHLVVERADEARQAVEWLQAHGRGRATFLPLDSLRVTAVPAQDRGLGRLPGAVGWMAELVRFPERIRPAVLHTLGRVLVATELAAAIALGRRHQFRYRMVTLDGQVVHAGGAITGGSQDDRHGVQARQVELEELTRRVEEGQAHLKAQEGLLHSSRQELQAVEVQLDGLRERLTELRHRWRGRGEQLQRLAALPEPAVLEAEREALVGEGQKAQALLERYAQERQALEESLAAQEAELAQATARLDAFHREQATWRRWQVERERWREERERERQQLSERMAILTRETAERERGLSALVANLKTWQAHLEEARQERDALAIAVKELRQQQQSWDSALMNARKQLQGLWARRVEAERRLAHLEAAWEGYVPPEGAEGFSHPDAEAEAVRRVEELNGAIQALGPVSEGSLAWWRHLKEREAALRGEAADVLRAKRELEAAIHDLDREVARRVAQTGQAVEQAFDAACAVLLGGSGGLEWTSGAEGGVELWVQPGGKRRGPLATLSGGEKALSGIAWLFALLAVHPAPFVILDEAEASLDEANVRRFAEFLSQQKRRSQFLVVTHHRATMAVADVLWGFSAHRRGVTQLVAVRLDEAEESVGEASPRGATGSEEGREGDGVVGSPA
ncbi:MAG: chromosome segregation protein SMC [Firmicutes bacterium]|nr:chromosome segregation protein SMC [Bacillota bacterium]